MKPANLLFFLSDNHARSALGCYGNPVVRSPALDGLAARGTRFANAYTASPLCCPARASIATGRFPFQTGYWDNAIVYDGRVPSWMHRLRDAGADVVSVGKLHFRSTDDDNGFSHELAPMHILNAKGGVSMLLRWSDEEPVNRGQWELYLEQSGVGTTHYQEYDREISRLAKEWLMQQAGRQRDRPWALFVSYVSSHPPFTVSQELLDLYPFDAMPLPPMFRPDERPQHPSLAHLRRIMGFKAMDDAAALRRIAACYYALVTHLDRQIGAVLRAAEELGMLENTHIVYTSDHGEALGAHGLFGKANLLEHGAGVPLLLCGPGVRAGHVESVPVSHVDLYPTIIEGAGLAPTVAESDLPGHSLFHAATRTAPVFAEYHAAGSRRGVSMLRAGDWKLIHHLDGPPQLFNLEADPDERHDLGTDPAAAARVADLERQLQAIWDPAAVDARARADQRAKSEY
nr:sulfatase-like hydrolase/transferase [Burkholderiales bacterium]